MGRRAGASAGPASSLDNQNLSKTSHARRLKVIPVVGLGTSEHLVPPQAGTRCERENAGHHWSTESALKRLLSSPHIFWGLESELRKGRLSHTCCQKSGVEVLSWVTRWSTTPESRGRGMKTVATRLRSLVVIPGRPHVKLKSVSLPLTMLGSTLTCRRGARERERARSLSSVTAADPTSNALHNSQTSCDGAPDQQLDQRRRRESRDPSRCCCAPPSPCVGRGKVLAGWR